MKFATMAITLRKCLTSHIFPVFRKPSVLTFTLSKLSELKFSDWRPQEQEIVPDYRKIESELSQEIFAKINEQIAKKSHGRLFAVVQVQGTQFKVTSEDIIVIRDFWAPTLGDKIRLEKVLLVGCSDFTLIGRPLLPSDQVSVIGTVIEKTVTHTISNLTYRPRRNNMKQQFYKEQLTLLRVNAINILSKVNELSSTDGFKDRIF